MTTKSHVLCSIIYAVYYTAVLYMYICIGSVIGGGGGGGGCCVLHIVFDFPGTSVQASPRC